MDHQLATGGGDQPLPLELLADPVAKCRGTVAPVDLMVTDDAGAQTARQDDRLEPVVLAHLGRDGSNKASGTLDYPDPVELEQPPS